MDRGDGRFVPAGSLACHYNADGSLRTSFFSYGAKYAHSPGSVAVDPVALPLGSDGVTAAPNELALIGGFTDALPDSWGRAVLSRMASDDGLNEIELLLATSDARVGALAFGLSPTKPERIVPWDPCLEEPHPTLEQLVESKNLIDADKATRVALARFLQGSALGGARPKSSLILDGEHWLAKFRRSQDISNMPRLEHAVMRMSAAAGIETPDTRVVQVGGQDVYLVKRFDRETVGGVLVRRHFVSALSMLKMHESDMGRTNDGYPDIAALLATAKEKEELYRRMCFNACVRNEDDHLRNHGILYKGDRWVLSPAYDLVPSLCSTGASGRLAIRIAGTSREASLENLEAAADEFGISSVVAARILQDVTLTVRDWRSFFADAKVPEADVELYAPSIDFALSSSSDDVLDLTVQAHQDGESRFEAAPPGGFFCSRGASCENPDQANRPTRLRGRKSLCSYCAKG
jgi:serine/threonine-protein kinase HipA